MLYEVITKLTHRDMGPRALYLGPEVPKDEFIWQDPIPKLDHPVINSSDAAQLKKRILASGLRINELVYTAWASASTFRGSDKKGGANGGRILLEPQRSWDANSPGQLNKVITTLEEIQKNFNAQSPSRKISMADLIVLAGCAAVEKAAQDAGYSIQVPFIPGRMDAVQELTDPKNMAVLEPRADGFRVITSYSIHYTKLYDISGAVKVSNCALSMSSFSAGIP